MRQILTILAVMIAVSGNGQPIGSDTMHRGGFLFQRSSGIVLDTLPPNANDGVFAHITDTSAPIITKSGSVTYHSCRMEVRDTSQPWVSYTLYSFHNKDYEHDTEFYYNHVEWLRQEANRKEDSLWKVFKRKQAKFSKAGKSGNIGATMGAEYELMEVLTRIKYYRGKYDVLSEVLYGNKQDY